jgi:NifU-like protein involved in Fe-S cluster formation
LQAIGQTAVLAHSAIRFSFGRYTTDADIDALLQALIKEVMHLRSLSPLWKKNAAEPFGFNADLKPVQRWDNTSGCILTATKGSLSAGEVITIHLLIHDHTIQDTCFLAHGSASTIQACAALCRELIGQPLEVLTHFDKAAWAEKLQLPREKYHALLLIEEVLLDLYKNAQKPAV